MVGGVARNDAEHAVVCGRTAIPKGEPGEGFVGVAFNMRRRWQDDPRVEHSNTWRVEVRPGGSQGSACRRMVRPSA